MKDKDSRFSAASVTDATGQKTEYSAAKTILGQRGDVPIFVARDENYIKLRDQIKSAFK